MAAPHSAGRQCCDVRHGGTQSSARRRRRMTNRVRKRRSGSPRQAVEKRTASAFLGSPVRRRSGRAPANPALACSVRARSISRPPHQGVLNTLPGTSAARPGQSPLPAPASDTRNARSTADGRCCRLRFPDGRVGCGMPGVTTDRRHACGLPRRSPHSWRRQSCRQRAGQRVRGRTGSMPVGLADCATETRASRPERAGSGRWAEARMAAPDGGLADAGPAVAPLVFRNIADLFCAPKFRHAENAA